MASATVGITARHPGLNACAARRAGRKQVASRYPGLWPPGECTATAAKVRRPGPPGGLGGR
jgi:hypothetical protein